MEEEKKKMKNVLEEIIEKRRKRGQCGGSPTATEQ